MKLLTYEQLRARGLPYTRRHLRDMCRDGRFPKPIELSEGRIAWLEDEFEQWITDRVAKRDAQEGA